MKNITATVSRGNFKNTILTPHLYSDGNYQLSKGGKGGNKADAAIKLTNKSDLETYVQLGYGIRMSAKGVAPSLFMPKSLNLTNETNHE